MSHYYYYCCCYFFFLRLEQFLSLFLSFLTLTVLRNAGQLFCLSIWVHLITPSCLDSCYELVAAVPRHDVCPEHITPRSTWCQSISGFMVLTWVTCSDDWGPQDFLTLLLISVINNKFVLGCVETKYPHHFYPLVLTSIDWWFSSFIFPSTFISWLSTVKKCLPCLFIYPFIYIRKDLLILFYSVGYTPLLSLFCCEKDNSFHHVSFKKQLYFECCIRLLLLL